MITNAKLYAPVVYFSINDNIEFLENINKDLKEKFLEKIIDLK